MKRGKTVLVSSCLLGVCAKYNGSHNKSADVLAMGKHCTLVPVCPEQLGGLPTPRPPAEITGGEGTDVLAGCAQVCTSAGEDITKAFVQGANQTFYLAQLFSAQAALLKARSPSCGSGEVYNGTFNGILQQGDGVTTALLKAKGITVYNELEVAKLRQWLQERDS